MQFNFTSQYIKLGFGLILNFLNFLVMAQPAGVLYDPEPPADSAYVRVLLASREGMVDVMVDGRPRIQKLMSGEASQYMVITAGQHNIAVYPTGKSTAYFNAAFEVIKGRAVTLAFTTLGAGVAPVRFEDKANSNRLKALLVVYNLDVKVGALDVLASNGSVKVFSNVGYGTSVSVPVNPISIDLIAVRVGDNAPLTQVSLAMTQGATYSIFLLPGANGKSIARTLQSNTERYIAK